MKCAFVVCISLLCMGFALAQEDCQAQREGFRACMREGRPDREEIKAAVDVCLQNAGCDPMPQRGGPQSSEDGEYQEGPRSEMRECIRQAKDQMKSDLTICVKQTNPDFEFPERSEGQRGGRRGGRFGGRAGRHGGGIGVRGGRRGASESRREGERQNFLQTVIQRSCANGGDAEAAWACIQPNLPEKPEGGREERQKLRQQKKEQCLAENVSPSCQQKREADKAALCQCAQDPAISEALEQSVQQCRLQVFGQSPQGQSGGQSVGQRRRGGPKRGFGGPRGKRQTGRFGRHRGESGARGFGGKNLADKFCRDVDDEE